MKTRDEIMSAFLDYDFEDLSKYVYNYAIIPSGFKVIALRDDLGMGVSSDDNKYGFVKIIFSDIAKWKVFVGEHFDGVWELSESIDDCHSIDFIEGFVFFAFESLGIFEKIDNALGWKLDYSLWSNYYFGYEENKNE